jgi:3-oxoacyl-[acyl-carrier protein] reductase
MNSTTFEPTESLRGQVAVITGAAGAIGGATALRLARLGARLVLLVRDRADRSIPVLADLPGEGHFVLHASVTDSSALAAAAGAVLERAGGASILINSAGFTKPVAAANLDALGDDLIDELFAVNWRGSFAAIRAFAPQMKARGDGVIVNVSSIAGSSGLGSNLAYAAAKAGIDALTKGLAKTLAPSIRVLAVAPGLVDSSFVPGRDATFNERMAPSVPLGRVGTPDDVAAAIQACCTTLRYATGSIFVADGGRHLS